MFYLRLFILLSYTSVGIAEHISEPNMVYNKSSQLTVDKLNKTTEIFRDPTKVVGASMGDISIDGLKNALPSLPRLPSQQATQPLHDPTQMSGNFRQALRSYTPSVTNTGTSSESNVVPLIELMGKVYMPVDRQADKTGNNDVSSVVLSINEKTFFLKEGAKSSVIIREHIITVSVEEIAENYVRIKLSPSNETLLLH